MTPNEYCQEKAARSGSSFYYAFLFLPPERRNAITALYAYCREVDDVVDNCTDPSIARVKLAWWRTQVNALFEGHADHPVLKALAPCLEPFGRIYLPIDDMKQHGVRAADVLNGVHSPAFEALMAFEAERARALYREAIAALPDQDRRAQRPGLLMAAIYFTLLEEIEREHWQVLHQRISRTPVRKLWLAWSTWVAGGSGIVRRIRRSAKPA